MKYYDNKLWQYVTRAPGSAVEELFNYGVKWLVMSTESNLITSTSCELANLRSGLRARYVVWQKYDSIAVKCTVFTIV